MGLLGASICASRAHVAIREEGEEKGERGITADRTTTRAIGALTKAVTMMGKIAVGVGRFYPMMLPICYQFENGM